MAKILGKAIELWKEGHESVAELLAEDLKELGNATEGSENQDDAANLKATEGLETEEDAENLTENLKDMTDNPDLSYCEPPSDSCRDPDEKVQLGQSPVEPSEAGTASSLQPVQGSEGSADRDAEEARELAEPALGENSTGAVSYTHLRAHATREDRGRRGVG